MNDEGCPRSAGMALFLSLLMGGWGQLYNGQLGKGLAFFMGSFLVAGLLVVSGPWWIELGVKGCYLAAAMGLSYRLAVALEAGWTVHQHKLLPVPAYLRGIGVLLAGLLLFGIGALARKGLEPTVEYWPIRTFHIPSGPMIPTLQVNDMILVDTRAYIKRLPERFDIAVYRVERPTSGPRVGGKLDVVSRIVGLPGETVAIEGEHLLVDGHPVDFTFNEAPDDDFAEELVPEGHVFVLGDNVNNARDSRFVGPIPVANLVGKARFIFYGPGAGTEFP